MLEWKGFIRTGVKPDSDQRGKEKKKKEVNNYLLESFLNLFLRTLVLECFQFCN